MRFFINRYVLGSRRLSYAVSIKRRMLGSGYAILFKLVRSKHLLRARRLPFVCLVVYNKNFHKCCAYVHASSLTISGKSNQNFLSYAIFCQTSCARPFFQIISWWLDRDNYFVHGALQEKFTFWVKLVIFSKPVTAQWNFGRCTKMFAKSWFQIACLPKPFVNTCHCNSFF